MLDDGAESDALAAPDVARRQALAGGDRAVGAAEIAGAPPASTRRPRAWARSARKPRVLMVDEDGVGHDAPVLRREAVAGADASTAPATSPTPARIVERIYAYQGAGHSVGLHSQPRRARAASSG